MSKLWTVGMALADSDVCGVKPDTVRAKFTVMSLLAHHPLVGEIIVVDNNPLPGPPSGPNTYQPNDIQQTLANTKKGRYVPMPTPKGTSPPRNRIFEEARFSRVACIDSHVLLFPGFFESLNDFYDTHPDCHADLLHGTMVHEDGSTYATHMNSQWRALMWGTWGNAWEAPDGERFSCWKPFVQREEMLFCTLHTNSQGQQYTVTRPDLEGIAWSGHEKHLEARGCKLLSLQPHAFQIPGHGMGFFACHKNAWLPFHADCRGFGGEEMTTAVRYLHAGRRCWCVPGAKWWHDFTKPRSGNRNPYRATVFDHLRNYVIEFKRLGLSLWPLREHFDESVIKESEWQDLLAGYNWPRDLPHEKQFPRPADMPADQLEVTQ